MQFNQGDPKCKVCKGGVPAGYNSCPACGYGAVTHDTPSKTFSVVLVDQFQSISPYELQRLELAGTPMTYVELVEFYTTGAGVPGGWRKPQFLEVEESYMPPFATTTYRAKQDGTVEVWKCRWDSSG